MVVCSPNKLILLFIESKAFVPLEINPRTNYISILAMTPSGIIAKPDGNLPFAYKDELQHFKDVTTKTGSLGHQEKNFLILGRKTFEELGIPRFPGRYTVVLSSGGSSIDIINEVAKTCPDLVYVDSVACAMRFIDCVQSMQQHKGVAFVAGGASIYNLFHNVVDGYHVTVYNDDIEDGLRLPFHIVRHIYSTTWAVNKPANALWRVFSAASVRSTGVHDPFNSRVSLFDDPHALQTSIMSTSKDNTKTNAILERVTQKQQEIIDLLLQAHKTN